MNIINQLQRQYVDFLTSLFREGILDDQFLEIQKLQDESNPNFVNEIVTHFFEDSENLLLQLNIALEQRNVDYKKIDSSVHQFKGSSSSIGAPRVSSVCVAFKAYYNVRNLEGTDLQAPDLGISQPAFVAVHPKMKQP